MTEKKEAKEKKLSKSEQLKKIQSDKKALLAEQKKLKDEMNEGKAERIASRKEIAAARKQSRIKKSELNKLTTNINSAFSEGDVDAINSMADAITEVSAELATSVRAFAKATEELEDL